MFLNGLSYPHGLAPLRVERISAFSLVEVLVVVAIISILAALLLPALSVAKGKGARIVCANHLKQLSYATQMYSADNDGKLVENFPENASPAQHSNSWVLGNMKNAWQATNVMLLQESKLFTYCSQVQVFRCPADVQHTNGLARTRSYSMNGWMGSRYMDSLSGERGFRTFIRDNEIAAARPSSLWLLSDEHPQTIDDGFFLVTMDDSQPFASFPGLGHQKGSGLSFADAHVELFRLRDPRSQLFADAQMKAANTDWKRLKDLTTTR